MSRAGIIIRGTHGAVQVDENYANWGLLAMGTVPMVYDTVPHPDPMRIGSVTVTGIRPIIAFAAAEQQVNMVGMKTVGNQHTFYFRARSYVDFTLSWWAFDTAGQALGGGSPQGVLVRDAFGVTTFAGSTQPLNIVDFVVGADTGEEQRTYTPGRQYALIQSSQRLEFQTRDAEPEEVPYPVEVPGNKYQILTSKHTAGTVEGHIINVGLMEFEYFVTPETEPHIPETYLADGVSAWVVIDVTNLGLVDTSDYIPEAVDWTNASSTTATNSGTTNTIYRPINGISNQILLKVETTSKTGLVDNASLKILSSTRGDITEYVSSTLVQAVVNNGEQIGFSLSGETFNGIKTESRTITVKNGSSGNTVLDTFTIALTVDNDNNYNTTDPVPNPINFPNLSASSTTEQASAGEGFYQTFNGINTTITVRTTISSVSGNLNGGGLYCYKNDVGYGVIPLTNGSYLDQTFTNGQSLGFIAVGTTTSGIKSGSWTVTITNITTGAVLDTFTVNLTADSDNNYNVTDAVPNPVNWPNLTASSNTETVDAGAGYYDYFTGINTAITVRVSISSLTGNLSAGGVYCYKSGSYYGDAGFSNGSYIDTTFTSGQGLGFICYGSTTSGIRTGSWTVTITNITTGTVLDTFTVNLTADADNNYNTSIDYTANPISFANITASSSQLEVNNQSSTYTVTGITGTITCRCYVGVYNHSMNQIANSGPDADGDGPISGATSIIVYKNGSIVATSNPIYLYGSYSGAEMFEWVDVTFNNNDTVKFVIHSELYPNEPVASGRTVSGSITGGVYFDNLTAGGRIGSFTHAESLTKYY